jgi:diguanylate cyclase (GGDEF)-like protein
MPRSGRRSLTAAAAAVVLVAGVGGALIHAGLPREPDGPARRAIDEAHRAALEIRAGQAEQEAYGMTVSVATYLASLGAFGDDPPADLARFTATGAAALQSQPRDGRVDLITALAGELPARAKALRAVGRSDASIEAALRPLDADQLAALREGPTSIDPAPYVKAIATLEGRVAKGRSVLQDATTILAASPRPAAAPLETLPVVAGAALLALMIALAPVALAAARRHGARDAAGGADVLTGALTRRRLEEALDAPAGAGAVVMLDIDHFKVLNDRCGHGAGDDALRRVAGAIGACLRRSDALYRYGGEEFCVLLRNADEVAAVRVAERIREVIEALPVDGEDQLPSGRLTASIGVVAYQTSARAAITVADRALYEAKANGRNRVQMLPAA